MLFKKYLDHSKCTKDMFGVIFWLIYISGAKPFKCPHCEQRFRTSGHRKNHVQSHFRTAEPKKRRTGIRGGDATLLSELDTQAMSADQVVTNQVINIDQNSLIQGQNVLPLSLAFDNAAQLSDSGMGTQVLQGLEGIQLQLTGGISQGIQITGLDPNILTQTVQIDASLLQQLQQGNLNLTINPNMVTQSMQPADPNVVQNIQIQQSDAVNPNVIIQQGPVQAAVDNVQPSAPELQQVAAPTVDNTIVTSGPAPVVELQEQQPVETQQIQLHQVQPSLSTSGVTLQPDTHIQVVHMAPTSPAPSDPQVMQDEDDIIHEGVTDELPEHLQNEDIALTTTDSSVVLGEQQGISAEEQQLVEAAASHQAAAAAAIHSTDVTRIHVCQVILYHYNLHAILFEGHLGPSISCL